MTFEVTDIQRGSTHDGPGLRTVVFFKGCPLHCLWCHNPETQSAGKQFFYRPEKCISCGKCSEICPNHAHFIEENAHLFNPSLCRKCMKCSEVCPAKALEDCSKAMTAEEILEEVLRDKIFYRRRGGMTVSGGEPTAQPHITELLKAAKNAEIHTCMETCGVFPKEKVADFLNCVDLFLYDIKDTDPQRLLQNTGARWQQVEENLLAIDAGGGESILRCVLIPDVNMDANHAEKLAELYKKLKNSQHIELLPYHPYGLSKSQQLGRSDVRFRQPEQEELDLFAAILRGQDIPVKLNGSMVP